MAEFEPKRVTAGNFNNGKKLQNGDGLYADTLNSLFESQLWTQSLATNSIDSSDANIVGEATVAIVLAKDGTPRFKFSNIKGETGSRTFIAQSGDVAISGNWTAYLTQEDFDICAPGDIVVGKNGVMGNIMNKYPTNMVAGLNGVNTKGEDGEKGSTGSIQVIGKLVGLNIVSSPSYIAAGTPTDINTPFTMLVTDVDETTANAGQFSKGDIIATKWLSRESTQIYVDASVVLGNIYGRGISSTVTSYVASSSGTSVPTTGWQSSIPTVPQGQYLWTRTVDTYTDGTTSTRYTKAYQGKDGAGFSEDGTYPDMTTGSAVKLQTAHAINGVLFDGSAPITYFGICVTPPTTIEKTVSLEGFTLVEGARISVNFMTSNTRSSPTLNVNSTGAKAIKCGSRTTGLRWRAEVITLVYDGTNWCIVDGYSLADKPINYMYESMSNASPVQLFGGTWGSLTVGAGAPQRIYVSDVANVSQGQYMDLCSYTVPLNCIAFISGYTSLTTSEPGVANACSFNGQDIDYTVRTDGNNGGGCSLSIVVETTNEAKRIALRTYGYKAYRVEGRMNILLIPKGKGYKWQRIT